MGTLGNPRRPAGGGGARPAGRSGRCARGCADRGSIGRLKHQGAGGRSSVSSLWRPSQWPVARSPSPRCVERRRHCRRVGGCVPIQRRDRREAGGPVPRRPRPAPDDRAGVEVPPPIAGAAHIDGHHTGKVRIHDTLRHKARQRRPLGDEREFVAAQPRDRHLTLAPPIVGRRVAAADRRHALVPAADHVKRN